MMNAEAAKLGLHDTHFANPDGLDAPGHYSSAHDVTRLARIAMKNKVIRGDRRRARPRRSPAAGTLTTWNDLLSSFPGLFGVKTGHTGRGRLVGGRGRARRTASRSTRRCSAARRATGRNADLAALLTWGLARYRTVDVDHAGARVRDREGAVRAHGARARRRRGR